MASRMLALCMLLAAPCAALVNQNELAVNPIRKIVNMLQDMQKELEHEAESEGELFEKAMCTCENGEKTLSNVIETSKAEMERLTSKIEEDEATQAQLSEELKEHATTKAQAEGDLEKATELRSKEAGAFSKTKKSTTFSIDSLAKAIPQLGGAASASAFMQDANSGGATLRRVVERTHYLSPDKREKILNFLDAGEDDDQKEPSAGVAEIIGILKSMQDEMVKDLSDATTTEKEAALGFGQLKDAKEAEIKVAGEAITAKEKRQGDLALSLVNDKNSLDDATDENADGTKYLASLKDQCTTKMKERDMRKKMRTDEIAAISEAVKILSDDDALEVFKKAVPSALLSQKPSFDAFMQTKTGATAGALRLGKAKSLLLKLEKKHPSAQMDLLLLTVSGKEKALEKEDPGGTEANYEGAAKVVDGMIDNMVKVLHDEDVGDEHKKDWCTNETEVTQNLQTEKQALVEKLKADLGNLHDELDQTNSDIKVLEETIAALDKSVHEATEQRKNEHSEFVNTFATMDTARRLIEKAATRLEKFYHPKAHQDKKDAVTKQALDSAGLSLVTSRTAPKSLAVQRMEASFALVQRHSTHSKKVDPITIADTPKTYEKKESGGVIGLMMEMKSDLTQDMTAAETEEKYSAKEYSRIMKEAQETRAADVKSLNHKKSIKAELESKIADAKELQSHTLDELQNLALYMQQLDSECSFLIRNFEVRHEGRVGEEVGLEDTKTIVTGEDPPGHAVVEAGFESEHSEKQVDEHFAGGHTPGEGGIVGGEAIH
eukprot:gnl/MRDRNA2_/MRDRNA2_91149_c0_seq1.p1 gnl/MRDRNA2_/MRDRNA2_91149_c0~~gnl/MRDRNA2_/MRDRNA2_91149_c0_seq1.p1  ORF type:complete len:777 (+),score=273.97 gnl/MRDRNA2_/MRDRNA2_91149_c0_seq1:103-2433(+)